MFNLKTKIMIEKSGGMTSPCPHLSDYRSPTLLPMGQIWPTWWQKSRHTWMISEQKCPQIWRWHMSAHTAFSACSFSQLCPKLEWGTYKPLDLFWISVMDIHLKSKNLGFFNQANSENVVWYPIYPMVKYFKQRNGTKHNDLSCWSIVKEKQRE